MSLDNFQILSRTELLSKILDLQREIEILKEKPNVYKLQVYSSPDFEPVQAVGVKFKDEPVKIYTLYTPQEVFLER